MLIKFDTICNATSKRQIEAEEIAKQVDVMIIVGGKQSSNTQKLYEICVNNCPETYKIEMSGDLPVEYKKNKKNWFYCRSINTGLDNQGGY